VDSKDDDLTLKKIESNRSNTTNDGLKRKVSDIIFGDKENEQQTVKEEKRESDRFLIGKKEEEEGLKLEDPSQLLTKEETSEQDK